MALYLCVYPPLNLQPQSNNEKKKIRQIQIEGHFIKSWAVLLKIVKDIKNKGKSEKGLQPREA